MSSSVRQRRVLEGSQCGHIYRQREYVALLNNDTAVDADWLARLVDALDEHPGYDFAASKMILYHEPERLNAAGDVYVVSAWRERTVGWAGRSGAMPGRSESWVPVPAQLSIGARCSRK